MTTSTQLKKCKWHLWLGNSFGFSLILIWLILGLQYKQGQIPKLFKGDRKLKLQKNVHVSSIYIF